MDLSDPVFKLIVSTRVNLLIDQPFFGQMLMRLKLVELPADSWCTTAATDGAHLFYNREFIKGLDGSKQELIFLLAHEALHCVFMHMGRRGNRDPKIWNMAIDYVVNDMLVAEKIGKMPANGLIDKRFTQEMSGDEVYELLLKDSVTIKMPLDFHIDEKGVGDSGGDDGDGEDGNQPGGKGGKGGKTVDVTVIGKNGPPKLSKEDIEKLQADLRSTMIQAAQSCDAGKIPLGIKRIIQQLTEPVMDWRSLLDATLRSTQRDDFTFSQTSRRTWTSPRQANGLPSFLFPGSDFQETVHIAIAIDASGSMSNDMLKDLLSETKGIMQSFADFKIHLWTFDTKVYDYKTFTGANLDEIDNYPLNGGGGTSFECNFDFMKEEEIFPERFVMFTDGLPNATWGDPDYVDTLFVVHSDPQKHNRSPFGLTVWYEDSLKK